jgi:hypothetical protein
MKTAMRRELVLGRLKGGPLTAKDFTVPYFFEETLTLRAAERVLARLCDEGLVEKKGRLLRVLRGYEKGDPYDRRSVIVKGEHLDLYLSWGWKLTHQLRDGNVVLERVPPTASD